MDGVTVLTFECWFGVTIIAVLFSVCSCVGWVVLSVARRLVAMKSSTFDTTARLFLYFVCLWTSCCLSLRFQHDVTKLRTE